MGQSTVISRWFKGKELAFALGLNISFARLGSAVNNWTEPALVKSTSLGFGLLVGFFVCAYSFATTIGIIIMERVADKRDKSAGAQLVDDTERVSLSDIKSFNRFYWLITANCVIVYMGIFPFMNISNEYLQTQYEFSEEQAGRITGFVYIVSAIFSPLFGYLTDRCGYRVSLVILSSILLIGTHALFAFLPLCTRCYTCIAPLACLGIGYSIYVSALWPMIPYVVKPAQLGTGYGVTTAI